MKKLNIMVAVLAVALPISLFCKSVEAKTVKSPLNINSVAADRWADSVMATLDTDKKIAQLFVPRVDYTDKASDRAALKRLITTQHLGGLLFGKGTMKDYASLINLAQECSDVPMMITLDGEWGLAMRVTDAPRFPYNMGLGAIQNSQLLYEYGKEVGRECRAIGIQVDFAPVVDVNSNPDNPVIGYRSFGEDAEHVAELAVAFSRGMESEGVMSVAKHFPGHGDTSTDSHKTLSKVTHSRQRLDETDLLPFRRYIDAGLSGVMVGHLDVPALDKSGLPASMSEKVTTGVLKDEMGFRGLVFTDGLSMKGAVVHGTNNCVAALMAGADVLLGSANTAADIEAVRKAVASGKIAKKTIDEKCRKLLKYKYLLGLNAFKPSNPATIGREIKSPKSQMVIDKLADGCMTVLYNRGGVLPLRNLGSQKIAVVCLGASADSKFVEYCQRYAQVDVVAVRNKSITDAQMAQLSEADVVVVGIFTDSSIAKESFSRLRKLKSLVPVFFINPYRMGRFDGLSTLPTLVTAYDNIPSLQRAGAEAIFGGIDVNGRFPVNVAGVADLGTGVDIAKVRLGYSNPAAEGFDEEMTAKIDSIVTAELRAGAFTGCQVLVARNGSVVYDGAFGTVDGGNSARVTENTLFDLASVSKTNGTLPGVMKAYDEGLFELSDPIGKYIPELQGTEKEDITIRELLFHESGMPASIDVYRLMLDPESYNGSSRNFSSARLRSDILSDTQSEDADYEVADGIYVGQRGLEEVMREVYSIPLKSKRYEYSCLNFILLKHIQEQLTGVDLDQWVDTEIFGPLGAWRSTYQPLTKFEPAEIAATESDKILRHQHLHGYVHDETAAFSGGVQGNAGLFSNADDIAKMCQMWLNGGMYGGEQILSESTVRLFTTTHNRSGNRALGFDLLDSISDKKLSKETAIYGHTGFTGTCFWVDPSKELIYVFLSNRVNPTRENRAWTKMNPRKTILQAVYDSMN